jgi:hypothetical protein
VIGAVHRRVDANYAQGASIVDAIEEEKLDSGCVL